MKDHLRHRWWLRALLVTLGLFLAWSQWSADAGVNLFVALWALAIAAGALGGTLLGWRTAAAPGSRLPHGLQGLLVGAVIGAWLALLVEGRAPAASAGLLIALLGVHDDVLRAAWQGSRVVPRRRGAAAS
jgi:hypothetical protein